MAEDKKAETEAVLAKLKELREDSGADLIAAAKLEAAVLKMLAELPAAAN